MTKKSVVEVARELAGPIAQQLSLELFDVEFKKEGRDWFLRYFIDKPEGITHVDCEAFSHAVSDRLDEIDPIPQSYFLEVSSPGAERPLRKAADYERFRGHAAVVTTFAPVEGRKSFEGKLSGLVDGAVILTSQGKEWRIPFEQVAQARLAVSFDRN